MSFPSTYELTPPKMDYQANQAGQSSAYFTLYVDKLPRNCEVPGVWRDQFGELCPPAPVLNTMIAGGREFRRVVQQRLPGSVGEVHICGESEQTSVCIEIEGGYVRPLKVTGDGTVTVFSARGAGEGRYVPTTSLHGLMPSNGSVVDLVLAELERDSSSAFHSLGQPREAALASDSSKDLPGQVDSTVDSTVRVVIDTLDQPNGVNIRTTFHPGEAIPIRVRVSGDVFDSATAILEPGDTSPTSLGLGADNTFYGVLSPRTTPGNYGIRVIAHTQSGRSYEAQVLLPVTPSR